MYGIQYRCRHQWDSTARVWCIGGKLANYLECCQRIRHTERCFREIGKNNSQISFLPPLSTEALRKQQEGQNSDLDIDNTELLQSETEALRRIHQMGGRLSIWADLDPWDWKWSSLWSQKMKAWRFWWEFKVIQLTHICLHLRRHLADGLRGNLPFIHISRHYDATISLTDATWARYDTSCLHWFFAVDSLYTHGYWCCMLETLHALRMYFLAKAV